MVTVVMVTVVMVTVTMITVIMVIFLDINRKYATVFISRTSTTRVSAGVDTWWTILVCLVSCVPLNLGRVVVISIRFNSLY